jgi:hypothetical protein
VTLMAISIRESTGMGRGRARESLRLVRGRSMRVGGARTECMGRAESGWLMGSVILCIIIMGRRLRLLHRGRWLILLNRKFLCKR